MPKFLCRNLFGEQAGNVSEHSFHIAVRLMKLGTRQTAAGMNQLTQPLVMGKSFFTRQSEKPSVRHRDIADNDHGAAALCDSCNFLLQLLSLEPQ